MIAASEEIERPLRRAWRREIASRLISRWIWSYSLLLLAWTLFLHASLRMGWWQPAPSNVLRGVVLLAIVAAIWAGWNLHRVNFRRFVSATELAKGEIGLRTWLSLRANPSPSPVETLFLISLRRHLETVLPQRKPILAFPRLARWILGASALFLLFLLVPWGGGRGVGLAPRPGVTETSAGLEEGDKNGNSGDSTGPGEGKGQGQEKRSQPKPRAPREPQASKSETPKKETPHTVDPKYVPGKEGEGPRSWKDTLLYELPTAGEQGAPTPSANSFSSALGNWKKIAEETIRREKLDEEEARMISRYFDKLRP